MNLWLVVLALLPVIVIFLLLTLLAFVFLKPSRAQLSAIWRKFWQRAPRPVAGGGADDAVMGVLIQTGQRAKACLVLLQNNKSPCQPVLILFEKCVQTGNF